MPASIIQYDPNHMTLRLLDGELAVGNGEWMPVSSFLNGAAHVTNIEVGGVVVISGSNGSIAIDAQGNRAVVKPLDSTHGAPIATLSLGVPTLNFVISFLFIKARRTSAGAGALPVVVISNHVNRPY